jgi:polysaccharide transporter, PST family
MQKILYKNIAYLLITQGANFILPLITLPYITRVVGPENYGLIEFATAGTL